MLAIHLFYRHADLSGYSLKNKKGGAYTQTTSGSLSEALKQKAAYYEAIFPKELFSDKYTEKIQTVLDAAMGKRQTLVTTEKYAELSDMISAINKLAREGEDIKTEFQKLGEKIKDLDDYVDNLMSENLQLMTLFSREFRQLMGLSLPKNGSMITLRANMKMLTNKAKKKDAEEGMKMMQKAVADAVGFIHEAEILRAGLETYIIGQKERKQCDMLFIQTGAMKKQGKREGADSAIVRLKEAERSLYSTIASISSSTPKADLIAYIDGLTIGFSLKNAAEKKLAIQKKISWNRSNAISLGATGKTIGEIMNENADVYGKCDKAYLSQLIYSFHGKSGNYKKDAANRLRDVLDLASDLTLVDSLTGLQTGQNTAGTAQFFIVNNEVFAMDDIINAVIKSLDRHNKTGVFTANTSISSIITDGESSLSKRLEGAKKIEDKHAIQLSLGSEWANIYMVKTKISLTALMSGNDGLLKSL